MPRRLGDVQAENVEDLLQHFSDGRESLSFGNWSNFATWRNLKLLLSFRHLRGNFPPRFPNVVQSPRRPSFERDSPESRQYWKEVAPKPTQQAPSCHGGSLLRVTLSSERAWVWLTSGCTNSVSLNFCICGSLVFAHFRVPLLSHGLHLLFVYYFSVIKLHSVFGQ